MEVFPTALGKALCETVRTSSVVENIEFNADTKSYTVTYSTNGTTNVHQTKSIIFAVPASVAARMIKSFDDSLSQKIQSIYYPPVTEVFIGYHRKQVKRRMDGFGFLIPEKERRNILGVIWTSTLFAKRAPSDSVAMTVFIGGSRQPKHALWNDEEILRTVKSELQELMQIEGEPIFSHITRWEKAIPQYHIGHLNLVNEIAAFEQNHPGLFLSGNYRDGISVGDCIIQSEKMSKNVMEYLAAKN